MYALNLDAEGRVLSATYDRFGQKEQPRVDGLPEGDLSDYLYADGVFIYKPLPDQETEETLTQEERIVALEEAMRAIEEGIASV